jgi:hypothetical protein
MSSSLNAAGEGRFITGGLVTFAGVASGETKKSNCCVIRYPRFNVNLVRKYSTRFKLCGSRASPTARLQGGPGTSAAASRIGLLPRHLETETGQH